MTAEIVWRIGEHVLYAENIETKITFHRHLFTVASSARRGTEECVAYLSAWCCFGADDHPPYYCTARPNGPPGSFEYSGPHYTATNAEALCKVDEITDRATLAWADCMRQKALALQE